MTDGSCLGPAVRLAAGGAGAAQRRHPGTAAEDAEHEAAGACNKRWLGHGRQHNERFGTDDDERSSSH